MRLTAAGVTCSSPAALAKLSARAAASNARTPLRKGSLRMSPSGKLILSERKVRKYHDFIGKIHIPARIPLEKLMLSAR